MPDSLTGIAVGLAADASIACLLYYFYKRSRKAATEIQNAKFYNLDQDLVRSLEKMPGQTIPYGCVEGVTQATRRLRSHYKDDIQGVIRNVALVEHKSKRSNGIWSDVKNVIRDVVDSVPFYLHKINRDGVNDVRVHVSEPKSAEFLLDELTVTFDDYKSNSSSLLARGIDRIFGEVTKGVHEYEKMLILGTPLLGIGKLKLESGKVTIGPTDSGARFIMTEKSKDELIKHFSSQSFYIKIFVGIAGVIGFGLAAFLVRKLYRRWKNQRMYEEMIEEAQRRRQAARDVAETATNNRNTDNSIGNNLECVVCLNNPREVILLNCGHICLCVDCVQELPRPMKCPVCRQDVQRFQNAYMA